MADNFSRQVEEVEALSSIYGQEWKTEDERHRSYSIQITEGQQSVVLYVKCPSDYPSDAPPVFQISAPALRNVTKQRIEAELNNSYLENIGESIIFQWIEKIREILQEIVHSSETTDFNEQNNNHDLNLVLPHGSSTDCQSDTISKDIEIYHGNTISDRKSIFQGHAAHVNHIEQVKQILAKLYENRKIASATHNIHAYRIQKGDTKSFIQDCEDDGEHQAGGRLLHLLQILDVKNVLVVVTRWYGGIHLGPDRFRHINNAARQVLDDAGFLPNTVTTKKKKI